MLRPVPTFGSHCSHVWLYFFFRYAFEEYKCETRVLIERKVLTWKVRVLVFPVGFS